MSVDHDKVDSAFVARIHHVVELAGGIAALSRKCHLSRAVIHKYLNGDSDPSRMRLIALAQAAGVSVDWLATGEASPTTIEPSTDIPWPRLDANALQDLIRQRVSLRFDKASPQLQDRYVEQLLAVVSEADDTTGQMLMLGASLYVLALKYEEQNAALQTPPLSSREEQILQRRDPLFHLWCWRQGNPRSLPTSRDGLSKPQHSRFRAWRDDLRPLTVDDLQEGIWSGDGGSARYLFKFHLSPSRVFKAEQVIILKHPAPFSVQEGRWSVHQQHLAVSQYHSSETCYLVTETSSGKSFAILFEGEDTSHTGIILVDHMSDNSGAAAEFTNCMEQVRKAG